MGSLYIIVSEGTAGKTTICAGLAINLINAGKKVGYLKLPDAGGDDTAFMKQIPDLEIFDSAASAVKEKGVVLAEASLTNQTSHTAKELKAKVLAVETYNSRPLEPSALYKGLGESLLGVIINKVPQRLLKSVKEEAAAKYEAGSTKVLGVIPENRVLLAITVGELAECIGGKILNNPEKSAELVENYMVGAMVVDSGLIYFGRKKNKAAIIRGERLDMQLAALETSTSCLVLSGSSNPPAYGVLYKAETKGIPIITTNENVNNIIANIEKAITKTGLCQEKKLTELAETLKDNLDIKVFS